MADIRWTRSGHTWAGYNHSSRQQLCARIEPMMSESERAVWCGMILNKNCEWDCVEYPSDATVSGVQKDIQKRLSQTPKGDE